MLVQKKKKHVPRSIAALRAVARRLLEHPRERISEASAACGVSHGVTYHHLRHSSPERFLRTYGGDLVTDERVRAVLRGGLNLMQARHKMALSSPEKPPAIDESHVSLKSKLEEAKPLKYLGAHECQMLVDGVYCRKPVTGLYCTTHDAVVKKQIQAGFINAQGL